jgi:hypothetical protein
LLTLKVRLNMTDFIIKKLPYNLTSNAGLALAGQIMKRLPIGKAFDGKFPVGAAGITNSDILKSYLGLLVQGKNDFEAIESFRGDEFFCRSLNIAQVPSCSTLRQRMDTHAQEWSEWIGTINQTLLAGSYTEKSCDTSRSRRMNCRVKSPLSSNGIHAKHRLRPSLQSDASCA